MTEPTLLEVGRIDKAHGVRGEVVVTLTSNRLERLDAGSVLTAGDRDLVVRSSRPHQHRFLVHFEGVDGRDAADELRGSVLRAEPLEDDDELWVHELIGSPVVDVDGATLGTVAAVEANPASDLLVLDSDGLIPARFITGVSDEGAIVVDIPAGLLEGDSG